MLTAKEEQVLYLIKKDKSYEDYFFRKIDDLKWFYPLKRRKYFTPEKVPVPRQGEEKNLFIIPGWIVLPYLERISQKIRQHKDRKYIKELLYVIKNTTIYHVTHNKKLDNYRTWWYFVKILLNIPNGKIIKYLKDNKIKIDKDWLAVWLDSKFRSGLVETDIITKLLPKFLTPQKDDIEIAEKIISLATSIKWEPLKQGRIKLYRKKAEPRTLFDSYWLIRSFNQNAPNIGKLCSENVIYDLANKLKNIFSKEHGDHQAFLNNEEYRISAKRIKDFDFKITVERLHKKELESLKLEDRYFGILSIKGDVLHSFPVTNALDKKSFVKKITDEMTTNDKVSFLSDIDELNKRINNLYSGLYSDYSSIWFKSIAFGPEIGFKEANVVLTVILRDVLAAKCKSDKKIGRNILADLLSKKYQFPLFRRLALYIMNDDWENYGDLFWEFIKDNSEAFDESDYEVELYKLLEKNVDKFKEGKKELERIISKGPCWVPDEKQEHYKAYWKQKWYSAMIKDEYFAKLYEEQKAITNIDKIERPKEEALFFRAGKGLSSLTKEDMLRMPNMELVKYFNEFKTKDKWDGPTEGGLAETLRSAVKENPSKFVEDLTPFLAVNYLYVYNIFYGLENAWKEKKSFDWGKLFVFTKQYLNKPTFWEEGEKAQGEDWLVTHVWVVNVIADLIHEGTRDDSWAFPEDYLNSNSAEDILDVLIDKLPVKQDTGYKEAVTAALNTSYGRVINAVISLSLRKARIEAKKDVKKDIKWDSVKYNAILGKGVVEAFTLFGQYMPNFAYLNKPWVEQEIKEFESFTKDDIRWQSFIQGYLFGGRVYRDLYDLMRNHYIKALGCDFKESHAEERLIQHITIGYLRGVESLDDEESLFKKIIDKWEHPQLRDIVNFFWSQGDYLVRQAKEGKGAEEDKKVKDRIIKFWQWTYENRDMIKDKLKSDYRKLLSDLSRLAIVLKNIDPENSKWLLLSAPTVDIEFNSSLFVEYLDKFEDKESIKFVAGIFLEMLTTITPNYDQKHIISIVNKIYQLGDESEADKICNIYGSRGYEFLRLSYEGQHKK